MGKLILLVLLPVQLFAQGYGPWTASDVAPAWWVALHGEYVASVQQQAKATIPAFCPIGYTCTPSGVVPPPTTAVPPVPVSSTPVPVQEVSSAPTIALPVTTTFKFHPNEIYSAGGGYAQSSGRFAYISYSHALTGNTYATVANEYTLIKGQVITCTYAGITQPLYEFGWLDVGLTGLGGGCSSTAGPASAVGSGQVFGHIHFGQKPFGLVISGMKDTNGSGFKITAAPSWAK